MITSEVQRTLVKSPPELWTELSDPVALARHLAELGEIKITRVEPEKLVEWEAQDATGSVAIKASGWGTKVTLTVNRELPAPPSQQAEEDDPSSAPELAPETQVPTAAAEPLAETNPKPAPATEAARRAAGWPAVRPDPGPAIESDLRAAEATAGGAPTGHSDPTPWHIDAPIPAESGPQEPVEAAQPSTEPRRGFLARLFGGRRRRQAEELRPDPVESPPTLAAELLAAVEVTVPDAESSSERVAQEPMVSEPILVSSPPDVDIPELSEPTAVSEPAAEPNLIVAAEPVAEPEPLIEPELPSEPGSLAEEDLAAELRAAEETTEEQVKAVLTGVLDRLGAAHHRPFSRA